MRLAPDLVLSICLLALLVLVAATPISAMRVLAAQDPLPVTAAEHCPVVNGTWCGPYYQQQAVPGRPVPMGNRTCPLGCNGVGVCNADTGTCACPAGYDGVDCRLLDRRPCANMGPDKRDLGWMGNQEWSHTRCAGLCDDTIAMCYCPPESRFGRIAAPTGSPNGSAPLQRGRPLFWCQPSTDAEGQRVAWGAVTYPDLFGKEHGWCEADVPTFKCPCRMDGYLGELCNIPVEQICINQCSGRGECQHGFCKCYDDFYGHDCSRRRAGTRWTFDDSRLSKPWLRQVITPVAAAIEPPLPERKRPFVYVYELRTEFTSDILQYRIDRNLCTYRHFWFGNSSSFQLKENYAIEMVMHELMLTSEHRTFDPEEADFFYVPALTACIFDVFGWNARPAWPTGVHGPRPMAAANMMQAAQKWLAATHPYFNRSGGADHIWLSAHDEGACSVPRAVWPGIMLTHWGRTDFPHTAYSQYLGDNYSWEIVHELQPHGWLNHTSRTHPCFDPEKDLVIPVFKPPHHYRGATYLGADPRNRSVLLFFKGDLGEHRDDKACRYSRCIRQRLANISRDQQWLEKHNAVYGTQAKLEGSYSEQLSSSIFCLVLPGDGWSARFEDCVLHGCIPVIVMDDTMGPFETLLNYTAFTLRVAQANLTDLIHIVKAVSPERITEMQQSVHKLWYRFRYMGLTLIDEETRGGLVEDGALNGGVLPRSPGRQYALSRVDDAFSTIMQWLYSRVPATRGAGRPTTPTRTVTTAAAPAPAA